MFIWALEMGASSIPYTTQGPIHQTLQSWAALGSLLGVLCYKLPYYVWDPTGEPSLENYSCCGILGLRVLGLRIPGFRDPRAEGVEGVST